MLFRSSSRSRTCCRVAVTTVHDVDMDITGCTTRQQVRDRLEEQIAGLSGLARLTVRGELEPSLELREGDLRDVMRAFDAVRFRIGELRPAYAIDAIRDEQTVRGQFVRDVLAAGLPTEEERRVLATGLRALGGRGDLEVL